MQGFARVVFYLLALAQLVAFTTLTPQPDGFLRGLATAIAALVAALLHHRRHLRHRERPREAVSARDAAAVPVPLRVDAPGRCKVT